MVTRINKRIDNIMKVMREAKDYDMKDMWNRKLQKLFKLRERQAHERLESKDRMAN